MQRQIPWLWITAIALLLLAPGFTSRLFVDVLQGVTLLLVFGPLILAGAGFFGLAVVQATLGNLPGLWHPQHWQCRVPSLRYAFVSEPFCRGRARCRTGGEHGGDRR